MKRIIIAISALVISVVFCSCGEKIQGNGNVITQEKSISKRFNSLRCDGPFDVDIIPSDEYRVYVTAESNVINYIDVHVKDEKLIIKKRESFRLRSEYGIKLTVYMPSCYIIENYSSGYVYMSDLVRQHAHVRNYGSGTIELLNIETQEIYIENSGSGLIIAKGVTDTNEIENEGSGDVDCYYLTAQWVNVENEGSGYVEAYATDGAEVWLTGTGDVSIYGTDRILWHYVDED